MLLLRAAGAIIALLCAWAFAPPDANAQARRNISLTPVSNSTGDLDVIYKRRLIRILVPYSKTIYFIDKGRQMGTAADLAIILEQWLKKRHDGGALSLVIALVPTPRDRLLTDLQEGKGDIAEGNLTITPERLQQVDFVEPFATNVSEVVVTGPAAPKLEKIDDLSGQQVSVRLSSSYATHLQALSKSFDGRGEKPIAIRAMDEQLEDEDLLEMVNAGLLPFAIVDLHKARLWAKIFPQLVIREDLAINTGGSIAWAVRKNNPKLKAELDAFVAEHKIGTSIGNTIARRYYADTKVVKNAYDEKSKQRFQEVVSLFKKYGPEFGFEELMLIAQGYQESQLDQARRSPAGAVGIMQIKPSTAAAKPILIKGVDKDADANVRAGAAYLRHLVDVYISDPELDEKNRALFAFAAYNAGPGNLRKFRNKAKEMGLDPNKWFGNVEHAAAKLVGRETVQYVSNIYKYYIAYKLSLELAGNS